jgi:hypothetical protein
MFDFRYHVASLVAVIAMLGVGLLLGSVVVDRGGVERQRAALIDSLRTDFNQIKKANTELKARADQDGAFAAATAAALTDRALAGRNVVFLVNEGREDGLAAATAAVEKAGGRVVVIRLRTIGFGTADATLSGKAAALLGTPQLAGDQLADAIGRRLTTEWNAQGIGEGAMSALLKEAGAITVTGGGAGVRPNGYVVMANFGGQADDGAIALARSGGENGQPAVAAAARIQRTPIIDAAASAGLSTVDDVDTTPGAFSLVWVLADRASGRFGIGPGADRPFADPSAQAR